MQASRPQDHQASVVSRTATYGKNRGHGGQDLLKQLWRVFGLETGSQKNAKVPTAECLASISRGGGLNQ